MDILQDEFHRTPAELATDQAKDAECAAVVNSTPANWFLSVLIHAMRESGLPCFAPAAQRERWSLGDMFDKLRVAPGLRQTITCAATGLRPRIARELEPSNQVALIDVAIKHELFSLEGIERLVPPGVYIAYQPSDRLFRDFDDMMPWKATSSTEFRDFDDMMPWKATSSTELEKLVLTLLQALCLTQNTPDGSKPPILSALDLLLQIDSVLWLNTISHNMQVALRDKQLAAEQAQLNWDAEDILDLVGLESLVSALQPSGLRGAINYAAQKLGLLPQQTTVSLEQAPLPAHDDTLDVSTHGDGKRPSLVVLDPPVTTPVETEEVLIIEETADADAVNPT